MADFKIGKVRAEVFQAADSIVNEGTLVNRETINLQAAAQLDELLATVQRMTVSGSLDKASGEALTAPLREAANEARAPVPRHRRIAAALERAKALTASLTANAGMVERIDGIIKMVSGDGSG